MRTIRPLPEVEPLIKMAFTDKLALTKMVIRRSLREMGEHCAVAFSGGKDSQLVVRLVTELYPRIPVIFNNTGVEHPETVRFVREVASAWSLNLIEVRPEVTFWDCVARWGFPLTKRQHGEGRSNGRRCCYWLKDKPMSFILRCLGSRGYFTGITAVENRARMFRLIGE